MRIIGNVILDFVMNNPVEVLIIGFVAYIIAGMIMRFADEHFGIWFGRRGGKSYGLLLP